MAKEKKWKIISALSLCITVIIIVGILLIFWFRSTTVVLVVRHAEKDIHVPACDTGETEQLSVDKGIPRAQELAHVTQEAGLQAVYASTLCRTQQTAGPSAEAHHLELINVNQYDNSGVANVNELIRRVERDNTGQTILIAGHSDTVPLIIKKLGGPQMDMVDGFDNLFVVTISRIWVFGYNFRWTKVVNLKYAIPPTPTPTPAATRTPAN